MTLRISLSQNKRILTLWKNYSERALEGGGGGGVPVTGKDEAELSVFQIF